MSQRNLLVLLAAVAVSYACYVRGGQNPFARYAAEGLTTIEENALEQVPDRELFEGAMRGMIDVIHDRGDQHSEFVDADRTESLRSEIRQQFGGVGVRIGLEGDPPQLTIVGPPEPGSPAAAEDLRNGDRILAIDGESTIGMKMDNVLKRMRGMPETKVRLKIQRASDRPPFDVELIRKVINIESVLGDRRDEGGSWRFPLENDPRIAHVRIVSFGERTAHELEQVLTNLLANGAKAVVLDLRGDAGGSLDAAVDVCQMFLPAGSKIVETRGRGGSVHRRYLANEDGAYVNVPLVVLMNQDSASASEIVAACLQDNHRAAVGGQRSYGKGTVQQLIPVQNGKSTLKLTWASFWRPNDKKIHRGAGESERDVWGVRPDPGLERRLSDEEYKSFLEYRSARDRFSAAESANDDVSKDEKTGSKEFRDEQLEMAAKHLQAKLDVKSQ